MYNISVICLSVEMKYYSSWEPKLKGMGERLMERIVLGLLRSSGMVLPDILLRLQSKEV